MSSGIWDRKAHILEDLLKMEESYLLWNEEDPCILNRDLIIKNCEQRIKRLKIMIGEKNSKN